MSTKSPLKTLDPFLGDSGTLRVGRRLRKLLLPYEEKHRVILDERWHLASAVVDWAHQFALHTDYRVTYSHVLRKAWIVAETVRIKARVRDCTVCMVESLPLESCHALLPACRVTPSRPFSHTGVDYAKPFQILRSKGQGFSSSKGCVAVLICMSTKTIHLELVGNLTISSFLSARPDSSDVERSLKAFGATMPRIFVALIEVFVVSSKLYWSGILFSRR